MKTHRLKSAVAHLSYTADTIVDIRMYKPCTKALGVALSLNVRLANVTGC